MGTFDITKTEDFIIFTVGEIDFEALPADNISASVLTEYFRQINDGNLFRAHDMFFKTVLTEDSYINFKHMLLSKENPITVSVLGDITSWLIGDEYCGGKNYGRAEVLIAFALDNWEEFDSWCLIHGIEKPWKLPSYRFGALVVAYLKEDKTTEGLEKINDSLAEADLMPHPFLRTTFRHTVKSIGGILASSATRETIDNVVYDSRLTDLSVEERKKRESIAAGKPFRVPDWWRGEKTNYKVAKSMMTTLPKKIGPIKD